MKIPRFWAKGPSGMSICNPGTGEPMSFSCWGWSDVSRNDAEAMAEERTKAVVAMIQAGKRPDIMEEWKRPDGSLSVAITRNSLGCLVMNATTIMFVDVDIPESDSPGLFASLFGGKKGPDPREQKERDAIAKLHNMIKMDIRCGVRIYRTRGGLRYLLTHSHTSPTSDATLSAMKALGSDPLYIKLCKVQECFRARLTPKPWRCDIPVVHLSYPWKDESAEQSAREWINNYSKESEAYATCSLVEHIGNKAMDSEISRAVEFHDRMTKAASGLELA
jgi:hypothetical protein